MIQLPDKAHERLSSIARLSRVVVVEFQKWDNDPNQILANPDLVDALHGLSKLFPYIIKRKGEKE
jgi:hypothetical protein